MIRNFFQTPNGFKAHFCISIPSRLLTCFFLTWLHRYTKRPLVIRIMRQPCIRQLVKGSAVIILFDVIPTVLLCRWYHLSFCSGNWSLERLNHLPKVTEQVRAKTGAKTELEPSPIWWKTVNCFTSALRETWQFFFLCWELNQALCIPDKQSALGIFLTCTKAKVDSLQALLLWVKKWNKAHHQMLVCQC